MRSSSTLPPKVSELYSAHFEAPSDGTSNATFASTAPYAAFAVALYAAFNVVYFNLHQSNGLQEVYKLK